MLLAHLESFVTVARVRSVSRAAEALFVSQPALTARLNRLEEELGQQLLIRRPNDVRLTDAGAAFLPHAQRALAALADGRQLLERVRQGVAGNLSVGATSVVSTYLLPSVIKHFNDAFPEIHLTIRNRRTSPEVLDLVRRGDIHLGLVRDVSPADLASAPLFDDDLVLVVAADHPFGRTGRVSLHELASARFIGFEATSILQQQTLSLLRQAGASLQDLFEVDSAETARQMVTEGLGVALLPNSAVVDAVVHGRLREVMISDTKSVRSRIFAVRRERGGADLLMAKFLQVARATHPAAHPSLVFAQAST